ncbi:MAG: EamA family transporter RarD [Arcanobacterium sp.]|nr:EamA family transporter RarD [Arcanobacterium sp.]MDY5588960.1 EamA family transporter RarD [Arcanobacterium sp.]
MAATTSVGAATVFVRVAFISPLAGRCLSPLLGDCYATVQVGVVARERAEPYRRERSSPTLRGEESERVTEKGQRGNMGVKSQVVAVENATGDARSSTARGWIMGAGSYVVWIFFPLYFNLLTGTDSLEVITHRALWGLVTCVVLIAALRQLHELRVLLTNRALVARLLLAGALIVGNWTFYVYAVTHGQVIDAAFGYFINPLLTVGLGVLVRREKLTRAQLIAVSLGGVGVLYLLVTLHIVPWLSLGMALTFAFYSLVKKNVAHAVAPLPGMVVETSAMLPLLFVYTAVLAAHGGTSFQRLAAAGQPWGGQLLLLIGSGVMTVIPLVFFAIASQTLPLGVLGLLQYVNPVGQLLIGVYVLGEPMEMERWVATAIVCVALVVLSSDAVQALRKR